MSDFSHSTDEKRKNRKRKKSVLKNARKYAKKGQFGRGSHLDADKYQYFVRVLELWREGFATDEEKLIFVNNVFEETEKEEANYSCNQIGCRVIETLLPFANCDVIFRYTTAFGADLRVYCSDQFASYVVQALVRTCCKKSLEEEDEITKNRLKDFSVKVGKFLLNNIEDYISDTYGNHIIRTVFEAFIGKYEDKKADKGIKIEKEEKIKVEIPEEYKEVVREYANRLIVWPHFKDLPYNELSSGLLQIMLVVLKEIDSKLLKTVVKKLIDESFAVATEENNKLPDVFSSKPATYLLETTIIVATTKHFTQIYAKCFQGHLATLAKMRGCNMSVQKLLQNCREKSEFEAMFDELSDCFEEIISCSNTGVIMGLAQVCKNLSAKQGNFIQSLTKALHCTEPRERELQIVPTAIRLIPYEKLDVVKDQHYFVNLHGSVIIQTMLEFNKPIKMVNSILNMEPTELKKLFSDPKGSHIIDTYMQSVTVGEKSREKLIYRMMGTYQELAVSKYGSRSLESIFEAANLKQKLKIMEELSYKDGLWTNTPMGIIIANKFQYNTYKRKQNEWAEIMEKQKKTKSLFADIVSHV